MGDANTPAVDHDEAELPTWDDLLDMVESRCPSVPTVTDADFVTRVLSRDDRKRTVVVQFFARNCPHCHQAAEVLEAVAKTGREIVKVDCQVAESQETVTRFAIGSFPTIILFKGGTFRSVFDHARTPENIEKWIARDAGSLAA